MIYGVVGRSAKRNLCKMFRKLLVLHEIMNNIKAAITHKKAQRWKFI